MPGRSYTVKFLSIISFLIDLEYHSDIDLFVYLIEYHSDIDLFVYLIPCFNITENSENKNNITLSRLSRS